ncbi:Peptidase A1 [Macrophomina phaseolina MS6]|uniref:Peptidase A1 n=1 Tax=Macrophomina phaseolina (strain MS6) TaxID=1126212 RepID=K2SJV1_MACPH|nr:Peptidase A1 [Macrophomina phaseolina MS6]
MLTNSLITSHVLSFQPLLAVVLAQGLNVVETPLIHSTKTPPFTALIKAGFGTPAQEVTGVFDTGSSDLVIPRRDSAICQDVQQQCSGTDFETGAVRPNSSSLLVQRTPFATNFVNGVQLDGTVAVGAVSFGGSAVSKVQFGLVSNGSLPPQTPLVPIFGVGPIQGEAAQELYPNLPAQMKAEGKIKSNAFSLYMNDFRAANGSVLFGGTDSAKFSGELRSMPILVNNDNQIPSFVVSWDALEFVSANNTEPPAQKTNLAPEGLPVTLLDSGNPGMSMPSAMLSALADQMGTTFNRDEGVGPVRCNAADSKLVFGFRQASVDLPMEMLMLPLTNDDGSPATDNAGEPLCQLPVDVSDEEPASLGAPFLQAAYVVFDMDNQQILMAQAVVNATDSQIQEYP